MTTSTATISRPRRRALPPGLREFLGHQGLTVKRRRANGEGTFANLLLTCQDEQQREVLLFCKYGTAHEHEVYGHKGGVLYEAQVYEKLLTSIDLPMSRFIATYSKGARTCLVLEGLTGCLRTHTTADPAASMRGAARWIGRFHAACDAARAIQALPSIIRYDADYYVGWSRRTAEFSIPLHGRDRWLPAVCRKFESFAPELLAQPQVVIHGEYYPRNVLWRDGVSYPVDWESAAIGVGEIDLVCLVAAWTQDIVQSCQRAYCEARWGKRAPRGFARALKLARMYQAFRWLGDRPEWTLNGSHRWLIRDLHAAARELRLLN